MPFSSTRNHNPAFPPRGYFYIAVALFVFSIISIFEISIPLGIITVIIGIFLLKKAGLITLRFKR